MFKEGHRRSLKKRPRSVGGQRSLNGQSNFRPIYGLTLVAINICLVCAQVTAGARSYLGYSSCLLAGSTTDLLASHAHNVFNHVSQVASRSVCLSVNWLICSLESLLYRLNILGLDCSSTFDHSIAHYHRVTQIKRYQTVTSLYILSVTNERIYTIS